MGDEAPKVKKKQKGKIVPLSVANRRLALNLAAAASNKGGSEEERGLGDMGAPLRASSPNLVSNRYCMGW